MAISQILWKTLYRRWPTRPHPPTPGYTLLVPVPGDLPVFLKLALAVLRRQDATDRVETLVIPDIANSVIYDIAQSEALTWPGELRVIDMPLPDRWIPKYLNRPHHNHWLQLINGARHARGQHALLHDADLFLADPSFLNDQYQRCLAGPFLCFGAHRVWDPWFEQQGKDLTATWELFFDVDWLRSFPPYLHLGHDNVLDGKTHTFDTTLFPQCLTAREKISWHAPASGLIHFNYVICSYRYYQDAKSSYEDEQFRLLLIRILIDLFDSENKNYKIPSLTDLQLGLNNATAPVTYLAPATAANFFEYRSKWEDLMDSGFLSAGQRELASAGLLPFDRHFKYKRWL